MLTTTHEPLRIRMNSALNVHRSDAMHAAARFEFEAVRLELGFCDQGRRYRVYAMIRSAVHRAFR